MALTLAIFLAAAIIVPYVTVQGTCTAGDVRLANGANEMEGRVEVCIGGQWGTVTDDGWNSREARVVCRQLGYNDRYVLSWRFAYFGQGTGMPILMDNIRCQGNEARLIECPFSTPSGDTHSEDAGVRCFTNDTTGACTTGQLRLANGNSPREGRVEVCMGGLWGTIADDGWGTADARVICRQLGYLGDFGLPYHFGRPFGQGTGHVWIDNLNCAGTEQDIWDCFYDGSQFDSHSEDIGVQCYTTLTYNNCSLGDLRLVNGNNEREGRIEVCLNGQWGTIADDGWSTGDAKTACRQLGFAAYGAQAISFAFFGQGTGPIWFDNLICNGREDKLINCAVMTGSTSLDFHYEDAGLRCQVAECTEGTVRLVNGSNPAEGRVELCFEGFWTTVCDKGWTIQDARVVCAQLGYTADHAYPYLDAYFGGNTQLPIRIDDIGCTGTESSLIKCSYSTFILSSSCRTNHLDDAGVSCIAGTECFSGDVRLVGGTVPSEGRVEVCIDGHWGTVADDNFNTHDAAVVCKQLGYYPNYGYVLANAYFGQGSGVIHMDNVACIGSEQRLVDCTYRNPDLYDYHSEDVGVRCLTSGNCTTGEVRLVGGNTDLEGRVEVCIQGVWGTVTDDLWSGFDAQVVCRQLGYADGYGLPYGNSYFGPGTGPIAMDNVNCLGNETMLINCSFSVPYYDYHSEDAGVRCFSGPVAGSPCTYGELRLTGGANEMEGLLEICIDGQWGSICDDYWTTPDANLACQQLGFAGVDAVPVIQGGLGQSGGPIWLTEASCSGNVQRLLDCRIDANTNQCSHSEDAGVRCRAKECENGNVTLVGGSVPEEGRVEICRFGTWGTVCDDQWGVNDAKVVCSQLGYSNETVFAYSLAAYGAGTGRIHIDDVMCTGQENGLLDCPLDTNTGDCSHSEDAAVKCVAGTNCTHGDLRLVGHDDCDEGLVEVCLNGHWGSVTTDGFGSEEAKVVCKQRGFLDLVGTPVDGTSYATASGQILMTKLACTGNENKLVECPFQADTSAYTHSTDAGVKCFQAQLCSTGDLRLTGRNSESQGRVEICLGGKWGTVADTAWNNNAATVVCRQLGYAAGSTWTNTYFGCAPIYLHSATCKGNENKLTDCTLDSDTSEDTHAQDVGVMCSGRVSVATITMSSTVLARPSSTRTAASTSEVPTAATRPPEALEMTPFIIGSSVVGVVLIAVVVILVVAVCAVIIHQRSAKLAVQQDNTPFSATFPHDTASVGDISNPVYAEHEIVDPEKY